VAVDPGPCRWELPDPSRADRHGVVGLGADLEPATLLAAYRAGMFPMPTRRGGPLAWWSPDPRAVLPLDGLRVTRSMRRSARCYDVRVDTAFEAVMRACADPARDHGWITDEFIAAYVRLHELGWAHSVEAWTPEGELAGGLYGVAVGGFFAGESMFHRRTDASKVALMGLVDLLTRGGATLLDVQWSTDHLASLGAEEVPRQEYLRLLAAAVDAPVDPWRSAGS
jgi:leucyl/phenylalanyl-tRNA--protein transferase